jgi:hypothetical protein
MLLLFASGKPQYVTTTTLKRQSFCSEEKYALSFLFWYIITKENAEANALSE